MDYTLITKAGISTGEAAFIIGVSDVMLWKYMRQGQAPRSEFKGVPIRKRVEVFLHILEKLLESGKLPKVDIPFSKRMAPEIRERREVLKQKLKQLVDERVAVAPANQ